MNGTKVLEGLRKKGAQPKYKLKTGTHVVVKYLGHCGATQNRYVIHRGTEAECEEYLENLPRAPRASFCQHCGGYAQTGDFRDVCCIEEA